MISTRWQLVLHGLRLAQSQHDLLQQTQHLAVEVGGVVDDSKVGVPRPGCQGLFVQFDGLLRSFGAGSVVGGGIEGQGPVGRRDQMEDRVVLVPEAHLVLTQLLQDAGELLRRHVGLVVHGAPIVDDDHVVVAQGLRRPAIEPLPLQLVADLDALEGEIIPAVIAGHAAVGQLREGLRQKDDGIARAGQGVLEPAHGRGLAAAGTAGDDDGPYLLLAVGGCAHMAPPCPYTLGKYIRLAEKKL